jgi:hypothetical protein
VKTLALGAEGTGLEQSLDSQGNSNISNVPTHNPTHEAPLPKHEASSIALEELIALWPTLAIASQIRIYETAQAEASRIASDASAKRGAK